MLTPNGQVVTDQEQICNILNRHFVTNGPNRASKIPNVEKSAKDYLPPIANYRSMFMSPTCAQEIEEKIDKLKIGKASGPDGIIASFLKHGKKSIYL